MPPGHPPRAAGQHRASLSADRQLAADGPAPASSRGQWVRAALVTPWFAVGAGFVVAALLALHSPHQVLSFGPPSFRPSYRQCRHPHCEVTERGKLAVTKPGVKIRTPAPAMPSQAPAAAPASPAHPAPTRQAARPAARPAARIPVTMSYQVVRQGQFGFLAFLTMRSSRDLGTWTLRFTLPGDRISAVWGAKWSLADGGSEAEITGQPWPWPEPNGSTVRLAVTGTGSASGPADCVFDGRACAVTVPPAGNGYPPGGGQRHGRPGRGGGYAVARPPARH